MKTQIYAIRDTKAEAFLKPFFERTNGTASRAVQEATKNDENFGRHAEDYSLWHIGSFDDSNGKITSHVPLHLANLIDLRDFKDAERGTTQPEITRTETIMGKDFPDIKHSA